MAKMKLVVGEKYKLSLNECLIEGMTYDGVEEDYDCQCDYCGRNILNPHFFIDYNKNGTVSSSFHIGSECLKKVVQYE